MVSDAAASGKLNPIQQVVQISAQPVSSHHQRYLLISIHQNISF